MKKNISHYLLLKWKGRIMNFELMAGKKVLLLISSDSGIETLLRDLYDQVIIFEGGEGLSFAINEISQSASRLDVIARGTGNLVFLNAMKGSIRSPKPVSHYFALSPLVKEKEDYSFPLQKCKNAFVLYSQMGDVLPFLFTLAPFERDQAFSGDESLARLPHHLQLVDCTEFLEENGNLVQIASFIRKRILSHPPMPWDAAHIRLSGDGEAEELADKPSRFYDLVSAATVFALSCSGGV